jgi:hypothetical protein
MNKPTAADLRADTRIAWEGTFNLPAATPDPLTLEIDKAWAYVTLSTGQDLDTLTDATLMPIAKEAVVARTVQQAATMKGDFSDVLNSVGGVTSFSVPGYSETRQLGGTTKRRGQDGFWINQWSYLDELLWLLATDAKRDYWRALAEGKQSAWVGFAFEEERLPLFGIERELEL